MAICEHCGAKVESDELYPTLDDGLYCWDCIEEQVHECGCIVVLK